jgi:hypothetical protein
MCSEFEGGIFILLYCTAAIANFQKSPIILILNDVFIHLYYALQYYVSVVTYVHVDVVVRTVSYTVES